MRSSKKATTNSKVLTNLPNGLINVDDSAKRSKFFTKTFKNSSQGDKTIPSSDMTGGRRMQLARISFVSVNASHSELYYFQDRHLYIRFILFVNKTKKQHGEAENPVGHSKTP